MNKEYAYKDGKALIVDDKNNQKEIVYYDNLDKVLVKENLIEEMEKEIESLEEEITNFPKQSKSLSDFLTLLPLILTTLGSIILFYFFSKAPDLSQIINTTLFGPINAGTICGLITSPLFITLGALVSTFFYKDSKRLEQYQNGKKVELEYLKKKIFEEKEKKNKLTLDKTNTRNIDDFSITKVDSIQELKRLKELLNFYYKLGYNEEKGLKYYQKGNLDKVATGKGLELAQEYFEEKEKMLVRRKK